MKTFTYENIQFLLGQNAQENWNILDKAQKINDDYVWFHLNSFPSSYVIMYSSIENIHESSLNDYLIYGANLCKQNSKYKNYNDVKICYTSLKKLTKTNKIGEVIVKGKKNIIKL
tara:strand:- start:827 stop:1171 length:345 start_codon:yes stop_codon:yes gene_type:complete